MKDIIVRAKARSAETIKASGLVCPFSPIISHLGKDTDCIYINGPQRAEEKDCGICAEYARST